MSTKTTLITGGAGFIGSNLAYALLSEGFKVRIFDNLSRAGARLNLPWLQEQFPNNIEFIYGDIRDAYAVEKAVQDVRTIYHFASQVAVTTSIVDPRTDFEINALGTINVLEAARKCRHQPVVVFTSSNKVYGGMQYLQIEEQDTRYSLKDFPSGISENAPLDFHSPYGCSKGSADQYVHDYSRIYDLPTIVFRMSCIYGIRQFGTEDQGWVAHFLISTILNHPITIYGTGKQVRDILWVEDLVRAFRLVVNNLDVTAGQIYNIGGGVRNSISIWVEFGKIIEQLIDHKIPVEHDYSRAGDQKVYISDTSKARAHFSWQPQVSKEEGIERLYRWLLENKQQLQ